ncbi:MAG TPA: polyphenol oxidase family protein, partial [Patescibacteria group bacterium]|nr:polyphenol oxidase family protein [Patescibacteria group bacterium]
MTSLTAHGGEPPRYFTFPALTAAGLPHASTTRHCPGVTSPSEPTSPFTAGARETLAAAGLDLSRVAYARQVHGADVAHALTRGGVAGAVDVLSTSARGVPLAIFTADCLAITLWDAEAGALALAHVGWRGTVKGAAQAVVSAATGLGARPARLRAAIAPSIGP